MSPLHTADDQALGALRVVTIPSIPEPLKMAMSLAASLTPPKVRKAALKKRTKQKQAQARSRPRTTNRKCLRVKASRSGHTPRTPPPGEKVQATEQRQRKNSPKKDSSGSSSSEEEPATNKALHNEARQEVRLLDMHFNAWRHDKITNNIVGWAM